MPTNPFIVQTDAVLGAVEVSTFIALILFGISLSQGYAYFRTWSESDGMGMKFLVGIILFLEASHSFTASQTIYFDTVTHFITSQPNSYPLCTTVLLETLITVIVQCFFCYRIFRLSENFLVTATCLTLSFLRFIGGLALTVESFMDVPNNPNGVVFVERLAWLVTSALAVGGAADVLIAATMTVYLRRLGSPANYKSTTRVINRLVRWSLPSVATIILFQTMPNFYSNSLLVVLTSRPKMNIIHLETTGRSKGHSSVIRFESPPPHISISFPTPFGSSVILRRMSVTSPSQFETNFNLKAPKLTRDENLDKIGIRS
ncbi:hypothetical protein BDN70DRAFT_978004 [Pholiota conissans]|uniref:DUF6534 domain-containing protein n=1 Tax=Pholiota conissans TaxID=109636 RepID=A0A9P5Z5S0_9AGAR|nr:hypothetical protein BDN70DRAFT_978004 [Pholiota conissans]